MTDTIQIKVECSCGQILEIGAHYIDSEGTVVYMLAPHTCQKDEDFYIDGLDKRK